MSDDEQFSRERILELLRELGARLERRGIQAELYVVGGAAMALAYHSDRTTREVDGIFIPPQEVLAEARLMAQELGLSPTWLSSGVSQMMPPTEDAEPRSVARWPGVEVRVASPEYLLAMKLFAARRSGSDLDDAKRLCAELGISDYNQAIALAERVWGNSLGMTAEIFAEDAIDEGLADGTIRAQGSRKP